MHFKKYFLLVLLVCGMVLSLLEKANASDICTAMGSSDKKINTLKCNDSIIIEKNSYEINAIAAINNTDLIDFKLSGTITGPSTTKVTTYCQCSKNSNHCVIAPQEAIDYINEHACIKPN